MNHLEKVEQLRDDFMKEIEKVWQKTKLDKGYVIVFAKEENVELINTQKILTKFIIVSKLPSTPLFNTMCFEFDRNKGIKPIWILPNSGFDIPYDEDKTEKPNPLIYNQEVYKWWKQ